jgi:hypothetical protein
MKIITFALLSAISAHAGWVPIPALPAVITKPGEYYFVGNMFYNNQAQVQSTAAAAAAITINAPGGPVVIDMRGFTLTGLEYNATFSIGYLIQSNDVMIQNGKIDGFLEQITNNTEEYPTPVTPVSEIYLLNLFFTLCGEQALSFYNVNSSTIRNCTFTMDNAGFTGEPGSVIVDVGSATGNSYVNCKVTSHSFAPSTPVFTLTQASNQNAGYTFSIIATTTPSPAK